MTSYATGSNFVIPGQIGADGSPNGRGNSGTGSLSSVATTGTLTTGVFKVFFTNVTSGVGTYTVENTDFSGTLASATGSVTAGATRPFSNLGVSFNITNSSGMNEFRVNDGFLIYFSQTGQNVALNALQQTGIYVTLQQFKPFSSATGLQWGAALQAMFNYCGMNPGVTGIIPPGYYDCSDAQFIYIASNMTISAYGAVIYTSRSTSDNPKMPGDLGFITSSQTGIHDVKIMGGTWGGAGLNGALSSDNGAAALYPTTTVNPSARFGNVFSLLVDHDLTLIDVTVRGWTNGLAYYINVNNNLTMDNCSFWNSSGDMGAGGIRIDNGTNLRITNSHGISGDDCLQFAPGAGAPQGPGIFNAFFIGGNVTSLSARAMVVTLASNSAMNPVIASSVKHVGFIGIVGSVGPNSPAAVFIDNRSSTGSIQDVTVKDCKLSGSSMAFTGGTVPTHLFWIDCASTIGTTTTLTGGVADIFVSNVTLTNPVTDTVYVAATGLSSTNINMRNVNFSDCNFFAPTAVPTSGGTYTATAYVRACVGYSFTNCTFHTLGEGGTSGNASALVSGSGGALVASYGIIDGCSFYTSSSSVIGQLPLIALNKTDTTSIQGWSKFFVGPDPIISTSGTASATSGIFIAGGSSNTFIDCVDLRGLQATSSLIQALGHNTRLGVNILTPASESTSGTGGEAGGIRLSKFIDSSAGPTFTTWPQNATVLELSMSGSLSTASVTLPQPSNDGEMRILSAPFGTLTSVTFSQTVKLPTGGNTLSPASPLRLIWDSQGAFWFGA